MTNVLKLQADTIVVLERGGVHTFVCFKYTERSLVDARNALDIQGYTQIELEDGNGEFVNGRHYEVVKADTPNRGGIGGRDNVLIVEARV